MDGWTEGSTLLQGDTLTKSASDVNYSPLETWPVAASLLDIVNLQPFHVAHVLILSSRTVAAVAARAPYEPSSDTHLWSQPEVGSKMSNRAAAHKGEHMRTVVIAVVLSLGLTAAACTGQPPQQEAAPAPEAAPAAGAYKPVITLNEMMVHVIDSNSHKLWDAEARTAPPSDAEWMELQHSAVVLAAAGSMTAVSGNGPNDQRWLSQGDWQKWSEAVSVAGRAAVTAVEAKDVAALRKAGDELVLTCINCHREYKLEVPTLWSDHEAVH